MSLFVGLNTLSSYSPRQESANCSPQSADFQLSTSGPTTPDPPKPRKFFKSRNSAPESLFKLFPQVQSPQQNLSPQQTPTREDHHHYNNSVGVKSTPKPKKVKQPKPPKPAPAPKKPKPVKVVVEKPAPVENLNKRTSSRTRNKVVNYHELDEDTIPVKLLIVKEKPTSPSQKEAVIENTSVEKVVENIEKQPTIPILKIREISSAPVVVERANDVPSTTPNTPTIKIKEIINPNTTQSKAKDHLASPTQKSSADHPPIVLRISKVRLLFNVDKYF